MSWLQKLFIASHKFLYNASGGRIGSKLAGIRHLLLVTVGRKTGELREHPLACFDIDGKLLVVASNGGADTSPAWYLNLRAQPEVEIQLGATRSKRTARTATAAERSELWPELVRQNRMYAKYEQKTDREIPVVVLDAA